MGRKIYNDGLSSYYTRLCFSEIKSGLRGCQLHVDILCQGTGLTIFSSCVLRLLPSPDWKSKTCNTAYQKRAESFYVTPQAPSLLIHGLIFVANFEIMDMAFLRIYGLQQLLLICCVDRRPFSSSTSMTLLDAICNLLSA